MKQNQRKTSENRERLQMYFLKQYFWVDFNMDGVPFVLNVLLFIYCDKFLSNHFLCVNIFAVHCLGFHCLS
uniref:Uncharacterized protein n=1 Tax=Anguilla anguilla TaxID=7936 RepID=A0A0E9WIF5_ANGAN